MNSCQLIEKYLKIFKRNGIYDIPLGDELIYIGVTYSYKLKTSSMILGFEYKKKKYSISIDVSCDCNCNNKDIIILFYEVHHNHFKYGHLHNDNVLASPYQILRVIYCIIRDIFRSINQILNEYTIKAKNYAYHYLENNMKAGLESYSNCILCIACKIILVL